MSSAVRLISLALLGAIALPATAHAGTCEDSFQKKGSVISGLRFIATAIVPDMSPTIAIQQLHGIVSKDGYDIMAEEAAYGSMLIEQPMTGKARAFPIEITATQTAGMGTVVMEAKLRSTMSAPTEGVKTEMCGMLNQLLGGKAGIAAANRLKGATGAQAAPVALSALAFSHQISKDTERNSANIPQRYTGKRFTIDGSVDYVIRDGEFYRVAYKVPNPWEEVIRLPNTAGFKTDISCLMGPGTAAYTLQLKPGKSIKLTGAFYKYDEFRHVVWLKDCAPAK